MPRLVTVYGRRVCLCSSRACTHSITRQQRAVAAVHYVDGDRGLLVCEWFPGLHDACMCAGIRTQHIAGHNLHFVLFREVNHDTIELGHTYNIVVTADDGTVSRYCKVYGYRALVSAQAHLSHAVEVYVTLTGGGKLMVESWWKSRPERPPRFSQRLTLYACLKKAFPSPLHVHHMLTAR